MRSGIGVGEHAAAEDVGCAFIAGDAAAPIKSFCVSKRHIVQSCIKMVRTQPKKENNKKFHIANN